MTAFVRLPDGGTIAHEARGDGPPLLLLRPLGGSTLSWDGFADALAEHARVITFDARGTGLSSSAPLGTTTRTMARDAVAVLDHLRTSRTHVYGISLGGMVASWLALDAPARIERLVLASTLPRGTEIQASAIGRGLAIARCLLRSPAEAEAKMVLRILSPGFRARNPDGTRRIQELARARPASHRALLTLLAAAARHDVRARLPAIAAQTLVLIGGDDPLLTLASQRELLREIARATYEVLPEVGHDVSAEAPRETAARVLAFLSEATPAPEPGAPRPDCAR